jgi:hypothetical protein
MKTTDKMISMVDFDGLLESIKVTAERNSDIDESVVRQYLEDWAEAKKDLFKFFGNKLIMEKEIDLEMTRDVVDGELDKIKKAFPQYAAQMSEFSSDEYIKNKVIDDDYDRIARALYPKVYQHGMKLSKILSTIFQDENFDIELSKILQNKTVKGKLCISIHPLDFATISTSSHKWNSCMHITEGFNKFGGYSLMLDQCSFVVYLATSNYIIENKYGSFEWNNKIWRQIFYLTQKHGQLTKGHYNGTPPKDLEKIVFDALNLGDGYKFFSDYQYAQKMGEFYYNTEAYSHYLKGGLHYKAPEMGVKTLRCVVCGKPFAKLVGHKKWLTCQGHSEHGEEKK